MDTAALDYPLPTDRIAQVPLHDRTASLMLVDVDPSEGVVDATVAELPRWLRPGDVVVVNETRVLRARIRARRASGGAAEVLLLEERPTGGWEALVRPSARLRRGEVLVSAVTGDPVVELGEDLGAGRRIVELLCDRGGVAELLDRVGTLPLPPYVRSELEDLDRYQTVYSKRASSAAAPTAGLHLTAGLLDRCRHAGAEVLAVDLSIGLATFKPITTERVEDHEIHAERYRVPAEVMEACSSAERVLAIGTTTVRALESVASTGELEGSTHLFVRPGHRFQVVDLMLTNFHQPRSSLLALVEAFVGPRWRDLYDHALAGSYRFLSFGDAMLLARR